MRFSTQLKNINGIPPTFRANNGEFVTVLDKVSPKAYKPDFVEKGVYEVWEKNGYFASNKSKSCKFSLVLPPPNITGTLHLGHALTASIQDVLVRWCRMKGRDVLWVPGLDHAGIATQTVVEKFLKEKNNLTRHEIGRDKFLREVSTWQNLKGNMIIKQLKKLGASLDWSKEIFTMDQRHNDAVVEALVRLWNAGLVYRKESLINWSCELSSAISDIEVDKVAISGPTPLSVPGYKKPVVFGELTEFAYKVCDSDEEVVVSTTRPETMLGDVAVAVHPQDPRFSHLHNAKLWHPFRRTAIPLVCDPMVDMQFGTGAVKITPGHDHKDWEVAERHKLPLLSVIDEKGCMIDGSTDGSSMFQGMKRFEAREAIRNELAKMNLLRAIKPHSMEVPVCSRSGDVVEYLLKPQWFISCKEMASKASSALKDGTLQIDPAVHHTTWFNWLDNIRDWCISRQLWWGHQMPMYCATRGSATVWVAATSPAHAAEAATTRLGGEPDSVVQDQDVLDTWFSSAIYPLSALGWPDQVNDFKCYYPLDLMETGHDILFFWVARMVMLGEQLTGQLPFNKVLLHGVICDAQGRKMSKSLGNVINPEDVIHGISLEELNQQVVESHKAGILSAKEMELAIKGQKKLFPDGIPECGTDALRFTLLSHNTKSHYISFDVKECFTNHHFCNKIWQATRFSLHWAGHLAVAGCAEPATPALMDRWILSQLSHAVSSVNSALETADFYLATTAIKNFLYYQFCDVYLEIVKPVLRAGSEQEATTVCSTLLYCLDTCLRLASPIMPFICEQLYRSLPGKQQKSAMLEDFPSIADFQKWENAALDSTVQMGLEVLSAVRSMKNAHGFQKKCIPVEVETKNKDTILHIKNVIEVLANCSIEVTEKMNKIRTQTITDTLGDHTLIHIKLQNISKDEYEGYMEVLAKKEAKIQKALNNMIERMSKKGYDKKTEKDTQLRHLESKQKLEDELRVLRSFMAQKQEKVAEAT